MDPDYNPTLQACPSCAAMIDVSDQEPFEQVPCPICEVIIRARTQFNHFNLVDVLGSGGMGAVYRALDQTLNRYVALKVVRKEFSKDPDQLALFEKEAQITASVNHPNVVKVFSYGSDQGSFYIAMELMNKGSLDELMSAQKRIPEAQALRIGIQIAQGLRAAQQVGLIHRDIKPGNILFADASTAKIVDFGLATVIEKEGEKKGQWRGEVWGTPFYVSPERLKNEPEDFRSDIYSLGASLFHAIAGKPPFEAPSASMSELMALKSQTVSLLAAAPDVLSPTALVIDRMLKLEPEDRFQSYDELIELLTYASTKLSAHGIKVPAAVAGNTAKRTASLWSLLKITALLLLMGVLAFAYFGSRGEHPTQGEPTQQPSAPKDLLFEKYEAARQLLLAGDYTGASASFSEIQESASIKPLMLRWVLFHRVVCQLLGGDYAESQAQFAKLEQAGLFSEAPGEARLASFFVETGKLGLSDSASIPKSGDDLQADACQSLSTLVLGLRQWRTGKIQEAKDALTAFQAGYPDETCQPYVTVSEFRPIVAKILEESNQVKEPIAAKVEQPVGAVPTSVPDDSVLRNELQAIADVQPLLISELQAYRFAAARQIAERLELKSEGALQKKAVLIKITEWLEQFKKTLLADLNREGFPSAIKATNGSVLEGGIAVASDAELRIKTPYGFIPIQWEKVSPDSIFSMAVYFLKKETDPARFGNKKWELGIYACQFGRGKYGRPILTEVAQTRSEYADSLAVVLELSP